MTLNLAHNEAPYPPAPGCLAVHREMTEDVLRRYAPSFGAGEPSPLAVRLAALCAVDVDRVVVGGAGSLGLITDVFGTLRRGDVVALPEDDHTWAQYRVEAEKRGLRVVTYPVLDLGDHFAPDVDGLLALAAMGAPIRLVVIASPANPTGETFPIDRVAEVARTFPDATVLADCAYTGCGDRPADWRAWPALTRVCPNLITTFTFSKAWSLAGLRTGWMVVGDRHDALVTRGTPYLGYSHAAELACMAALDDRPHYEAGRVVMAEERERYYRALPLAGPDGAATVYYGHGNFVPVRFSLAALPVVLAALDQADIRVKRLPRGLVRVTLGTPAENGTVLRVLVRALSHLPEPRPAHRGDLIPAYQMAAAANGSGG